MSVWFIDSANGSDSNDGLAAAAGGGHGPYATLGKTLGASGVATSGDTIYLAPGVYREALTIGISPASPVTVIGDVLRGQAWAASVRPGPVRWTAWTASDFVTTGSTSPALTATTKHFMTLVDIWLQSAANTVTLNAGCHDWTFRRCFIQTHPTSQLPFAYTGSAGVSANLTLDCCILGGGQSGGFVCSCTLPLHTADYDANLTFTNCLFAGIDRTTQLLLTTSASGAGKPRVATIANCTFLPSDNGISIGASWKADGSVKIYGCLLPGGLAGFAIDGGATGIVTEDYNLLGATTTALTAGVNSDRANVCPQLLDWGQSALWGFVPRPYMTPLGPAATQLGYGADGTVTTATDLLRRARPAGGGSSALTADVSGTATAGAGSTLTHGSATWTTNEHRGKLLKLLSGTGAGQNRRVASNTGTVVTTDRPWSTNPASGTTYALVHAGAEKAVGCYELHDTPILGAAANADGGAGGVLTFVGPGDQDLQLPVDATSTTIAVKVKWDAGHGNTNKPRAILLAAPELGLAATEDATLGWRESKTATGTAGSAYETLTFTAVTPSTQGILYLRLQSRSATGAGLCHWDTVTVS
jgi:hypothetical protein